ncbi:uncharacterized protein LOC107270406 isoform X2 [Cephus cinctus]|uniref:Uncharacterized protein LOC107270406 isoform X2 n=1 Tax=Cephus cinctus TaxID=211228 RepID=A0AAJ7FNT2_CEPCN|nr:uncharacterized protein LOC107270406 isoform X2 [Cephus cinctus]
MSKPKSMTKWKNLKDNYGKSIRKRTKSGEATVSGRQYIYAKQLSFLQHSTDLATTQLTMDKKTSSGDLPNSSDDKEERFQKEASATSSAASPNSVSTFACRKPTESKKSTAKRRRQFKSALLKFINTPITPEPEDQDRSFFECLLPIVRKLDEDRKLQFRSEVLNILQRIRHSCITHTATSTLFPTQHSSQFQQPFPAQQNFLVQQAAPSSFQPRSIYPASCGVAPGSLNISFPYSPTESHSRHASTTAASSPRSSEILLSSDDSTQDFNETNVSE